MNTSKGDHSNMEIFPPFSYREWSGGVTMLGKLPVQGRPTFWTSVGQGPSALAVGSGGGCLDISSFSLSLR